MAIITRPTPAETKPEAEKPAAAQAIMGHNQPPLEERIAMEFREQLLSDRHDFIERYEGMIAAKDRVEITDNVSFGLAGDLIKMYRAADRHIDETHKLVKQPYLDGGRAVDAQKNELMGRLNDARNLVQNKMNGYAAKKAAIEREEREKREAEERRQAEAAARAQREREAEERRQELLRIEAEKAGEEYIAPEPDQEPELPVAVAAAAAVKAGPVRSDAGSTVSAMTVWKSRVLDYEIAFMQVSDDDKVRAEIDKAIARRVRAGARKIEGCQVWETAQAVAR